MMDRTGKAATAAMMASLLLLTAGCEETGKTEQSSKPSASTENPVQKQNVAVPTPPTTPAQTEIKLYFAGTKEPGLTGIFPKGVKVLGVKVEGNLATVDFSKELTHKFIGGSTGEQMLVSALVNTMTEFPEIECVLITVEGERIETIAGHLDTSEPFTRPTGLVQ